jgi:hypothetical protein
MEEQDRFKIKLDQLRKDIQAGIASGDAGTLDVDEIKRRCHARHADALRETERRYEAGLEEPIDWDVAKQELRERRK